MVMLYLKIGVITALLTMVKGQQPAEELNAVLSSLYIQPENYKYEMHRKSLQNALENMLASVRESDYDEAFDDEKRSIATLAKNGQLPSSKEPETEMEISDDDNGHKRNIASMARSGLIGGKRNIQSLARQSPYVNGKRNIGSIMRNNLLQGSKRNIASLARSGYGKRNVGTLARDWALPKYSAGSKYMDDGKRNIQAWKNAIKNGRKKRDIGETESLEPVYQTGPLDYEELLQAMNEEKRFLETSNPSTTITSLKNYQKRHIGSMARSGWLPSFRPTSSFSRSGRTSQTENIVEFYYPQSRLYPATIDSTTSCRRCDLGLHSGVRSFWGGGNIEKNLGSLTSAVRSRSGFRSPPRIAAISWRDKLL